MFEMVARKAHLTKKAARESVETFLEEVKKALGKGEKVVLSGFGTFKVTHVSDHSPFQGKKNCQRPPGRSLYSRQDSKKSG